MDVYSLLYLCNFLLEEIFFWPLLPVGGVGPVKHLETTLIVTDAVYTL